jgi:hypothetical protein
MMTHPQIITELTGTFLDCRREDWDGYNALPVENDAFLRTKALLSRLMTRFPAPTASATPHGSLTLEWIVNPRRRLMVSVGSDEQIAYAGVFGRAWPILSATCPRKSRINSPVFITHDGRGS